MNITIDKKSNVPLYIQVKNQIMEEIKKGNLKIGDKLPTERELARLLNTSRNTISSAYNLLEKEGVLVSYQGRGTFVAEEGITWKHQNIKEKLLRIIDLGLEEALELGLSPREFLALVQQRISEKEEILQSINAVFVECNIEQAKEFAKELSFYTKMNVSPLTISDLKERDEKTLKALKDAHLIIATFNHVNEVKTLTSDLKKEVLGVAINPCLEAIVRIARYPKGTRFGLLCLSEEFAFKVKTALNSAGLDLVDIRASVSKKAEEVKDIIDTSDVIIVSPGRRQEVLKIAKGKEVINFDYSLDKGSVKAIMSKIIEYKNII
ncbi:transcriptional regulator, GntR family [Caloramator fervidus]|uniref:Transcriptional regulator, GntR family n=1 Tax=Caloramator fervidus TaxID=29344 RepID=A0A1H5VC87_9CLOT|nr:GntR family transcriptional regulator [Caloramator fervidus]SEF84985.1 transcriptional regulator, GntR family [Caloramator fervidus]